MLGNAECDRGLRRHMARFHTWRGQRPTNFRFSGIHGYVVHVHAIMFLLLSDPNPPGSAVYVFCIIPHASSPFIGTSDMTFFLDGKQVGTFALAPNGSNVYDYNVPVYANASVPPGKHLITLRNGTPNAPQSLVMLDYIVYTYVSRSSKLFCLNLSVLKVPDKLTLHLRPSLHPCPSLRLSLRRRPYPHLHLRPRSLPLPGTLSPSSPQSSPASSRCSSQPAQSSYSSRAAKGSKDTTTRLNFRKTTGLRASAAKAMLLSRRSLTAMPPCRYSRNILRRMPLLQLPADLNSAPAPSSRQHPHHCPRPHKPD